MCQDRGRFNETMTVNGKCFTFAPDRVTLGGVYHGLYLRLHTASNLTETTPASDGAFGWSVLIHGEHQLPETAVFTHGFFLEGQLMEKDISATLRTVTSQHEPP
jgi:hypothetical protein